MLIGPAELAGRLESGEPITVLDVRWQLGGPPGRPDYERSHIPTARFVDLDGDLAGPPGDGGRHPLPAPDEFARAMRRLGVCASVAVVAYDAGDSASAARCWWLLTYFGHLDVSILDGGFAAWVESGGHVESGVPADPPAGDFESLAGGLPILDAEGARRLARTGLLLDARTTERYRGELEPVDPVAGHIPGAVSAPTSENLEPSGRWRSPDELRERFARLGDEVGWRAPASDPGETAAASVGAYCGSGITAAHEVFALRLAGVDAALYPGSWSEWIRDPSRSVATGPAPG